MSITHLLNKREQLAAELAAHESLIADARKQERAEAMDKIKAIMAEHGITTDHLGAKTTAKPERKVSKPSEPKITGVTYNIDGVIYTTGRAGKPPAAYLRAKLAGTLEQYKMAA